MPHDTNDLLILSRPLKNVIVFFENIYVPQAAF